MSLYKRSGSRYWWCKVTWRGETIRQSTRTTSKPKARAFEDRLRERLWEVKELGATAYTWDAAAERWLEENEQKRSLHSDESIIAWLQPHLTGKRLSEITPTVIAELRTEKLSTGVSRKTVNRHMALLRALLRRARDQWQVIKAVPPVPMYPKEDDGEPPKITHRQFEMLASKISIPVLERAARFAVLTGLRREPIATLTWSQVDFRRRHAWISALRAKGKKAIAVPLSPDALRVLRTMRGKHDEYVFTYEGEPLPLQNGYFWKQWRLAVKAAGLDTAGKNNKPFRFHDLRHTWASWHIQAGTPPHILQELGAWSSYEMVRLYAHLNASHTKRWAANLGHSKKRASRK